MATTKVVKVIGIKGQAPGDKLTWQQMREIVDGKYAAAIRSGTHSERPAETVCQGCRRWVRSITYVTLDHKRLCGDCDPSTKG